MRKGIIVIERSIISMSWIQLFVISLFYFRLQCLKIFSQILNINLWLQCLIFRFYCLDFLIYLLNLNVILTFHRSYTYLHYLYILLQFIQWSALVNLVFYRFLFFNFQLLLFILHFHCHFSHPSLFSSFHFLLAILYNLNCELSFDLWYFGVGEY